MLVYLVDNTIENKGDSPRELRAVLGRLIPGIEILTEPFHAVSLERVRSLRPSHIILSGQSHPWDKYPRESLTGVFEVIQRASQPILGVCGGHQQIALAYGSEVGLMERLEPGEGYDGAKRERGFLPIQHTTEGVFKGLPGKVTVWHSHCDEVKQLPDGFKQTATNETCRIQAMQQKGRRVYGVQFHPELFDDDHPEGRQIVENFLAL
ncbi:MAG TPA: gamma-glutamyl-gamma-aminobutyrate hydrolase family protein [Pyrinomonadaceae bacterium]|jgi:GMP synthase (glutamine-hydrolysing)|nr:gamma-glutamyl-gamma-aminobutyrate hydrolase family protein [Pyrinomonadaceae bacterium]